ncbi:MAG: alpha/beta fold hydrolase [Candidatus Eremiobacteraeota bacterium]|nr:alpha/beta fold hydrolase [Candidatus Eremiobacteraeota bacterium]
MQVLADDGARIDASVDGSAAACAVVLIHGFPFARAIWDAQSEALSAFARVVRLDLRGAGSSSIPDGPYLMERLAADVATLLDALGIERAALVGHSMGGYVALAFARMFTERLSRLALVSSRLAADTPEQAGARRELADRTERAGSIEPVVEAYLPRLFSRETQVNRGSVVERAYAVARQGNPGGAAGALRGMALRASAEDIAGDLDQPVLVIAGECDEVVPIAESRDVASRFARGELVECPRSAHLPMLEEPDRVSDALAVWLAASE